MWVPEFIPLYYTFRKVMYGSSLLMGAHLPGWHSAHPERALAARWPTIVFGSHHQTCNIHSNLYIHIIYIYIYIYYKYIYNIAYIYIAYILELMGSDECKEVLGQGKLQDWPGAVAFWVCPNFDNPGFFETWNNLIPQYSKPANCP